jgi:hypothetical protein
MFESLARRDGGERFGEIARVRQEVVRVAVAREEFEGFAEFRVHRRLAARDGDVVVAERRGLGENFVEQVEREEEVAFVPAAAIDVAKAVAAVQIADVIEFDSDAWHELQPFGRAGWWSFAGPE